VNALANIKCENDILLRLNYAHCIAQVSLCFLADQTRVAISH